MKRFLAFGFIALWLAWVKAQGQATDTYVAACAAQDACQLNQSGPVSWVNGNQIWRFTAKYPSESIRIWILNRNTTSAHTSQTIQVFITDDSNVNSLSRNADRWVQAAVIDNSVANAKCSAVAANSPTSTPGANGKGTCYSVGMYTTQIAVMITGAVAAAGNPDTFDIGVVQQLSTYPGGPQPGNDSAAGAPNGTAVAVVDNVSDAESNSATQMIASTPGGLEVYPLAFNGATWDRLSSSSTATGTIGLLTSTPPTDGLANASTGLPAIARGGPAAMATTEMLFNGTTYDRQRSGAAGYTSQQTTGVALTRPKEIPTYSASVANQGTAATPTDFMELCGNAINTVQIMRWEIGFSATAAPAANLFLQWNRRSAADTGGTPTTLTSTQYDINDSLAVSAPRIFTTNPAVGALVNFVKSVYVTPDNILSNSDPQVIYSYSQSPGAKPWTLRGTAQCIYLNLSGLTLPAGFLYTATIEWIERTDI